MSSRPTKVRPSDLQTKTVRSPEGELVRLKVVKADSKTLGDDLLAAFRSNVRGIRESRRRKSNDARDASKA
jgi:hypothetical protein